MSPRAHPRTFQMISEPDTNAVRKALKAAGPFLTIETDFRKWTPPDVSPGQVCDDPLLGLQGALVSYSCSMKTRPYSLTSRVRSIQRAIDAFEELRDALSSLDYETQRNVTRTHERLPTEIRELLEHSGTRLDYHDLTQRYWPEFRAWIEGLVLVREQPPRAEYASNSKRPRDLLIKHLRDLFAKHGRRRRGVQDAEQERRFVNAILKVMGTESVNDPARRAKAVRSRLTK